MSMMPQALNKLRAKLDLAQVASSFSSLPINKSIKYHEKLGALLGIENPFFRSTEGSQGRQTLIDGKPVLNFAWCDYLGLSRHPDLIEASKAAIDRYGTSISASRMVCGDTPLHRELEQEIAKTIGVEASLVFVSGHAANVSTIGTIMDTDDLIVHDENLNGKNLVIERQCHYRTPAAIHERCRFQQPEIRAVVAGPGNQSMELGLAGEAGPQLPGERFHPPESGVVAGGFVFGAGIPEADDELDGLHSEKL